MRTIETSLYKFSELSKEAQENAISKLSDINVSFDWWEFTYMDAENVGLKITSFGLDRNREAKGEFINNAIDCADKILKEHGETCETFKTAQKFLSERQEIESNSIKDDCSEDEKIEELEDEFLKDILEDYSIILQNESEYLQSDESIIETLKANDYDFTEDGDMY